MHINTNSNMHLMQCEHKHNNVYLVWIWTQTVTCIYCQYSWSRKGKCTLHIRIMSFWKAGYITGVITKCNVFNCNWHRMASLVRAIYTGVALPTAGLNRWGCLLYTRPLFPSLSRNRPQRQRRSLGVHLRSAYATGGGWTWQPDWETPEVTLVQLKE